MCHSCVVNPNPKPTATRQTDRQTPGLMLVCHASIMFSCPLFPVKQGVCVMHCGLAIYNLKVS